MQHVSDVVDQIDFSSFEVVSEGAEKQEQKQRFMAFAKNSRIEVIDGVETVVAEARSGKLWKHNNPEAIINAFGSLGAYILCLRGKNTNPEFRGISRRFNCSREDGLWSVHKDPTKNKDGSLSESYLKLRSIV